VTAMGAPRLVLGSRRRRSRFFVVPAVVAALTALTVAPSSAASTPLWPAGGYLPSCDQVSLGDPNTFTDNTRARVTSVFGPRVFPLTNTMTPVHISLMATDSCSGVGSVHVIFNLHNPQFGFQSQHNDARLVRGTPWNGEWRLEGQLDASSPIILDVAVVGANDRYRSFDLDPLTNTLVGTPTAATSSTYRWTEQFRGVRVRLLPRTGLSIALSSHRVARGSRVLISGLLNAPNGSGFSPLGRKNVVLQSKVAGPSTWRYVRTGRTHSDGRVTFAQAPRTWTAYRLVYTGSDASFTLSATSRTSAVALR